MTSKSSHKVRAIVLRSLDYGEYLAQVRRRIEPLIADGGRPLAGVSLHCTGIMPLVHEIQRQLMASLLNSFLATFAVVAAIMILVQAGVLTGLIAMISEVFPGLMLFGLMGWLGRPIDIGSVMTASIALGITVDDTLHYLTFFHRGLEMGLSRREAVHYAHRHCGAAMVESSITCGIGLAVFVFSDFLPAARFAWMMLAQLSLALLGDVVLMPALLLSPLGAAFGRPAAPAAEGRGCAASQAA